MTDISDKFHKGDIDRTPVDADDSSRLDPAICPPSLSGGTTRGYVITALIAAAIGIAVTAGVHYYQEHKEKSQKTHKPAYETRDFP